MNRSTDHLLGSDKVEAQPRPVDGRRRRRVVAALIVVGVVIVGSIGALGINRTVRDAAVQRDLPAASASPRDVLLVYLSAAKSLNCDLTAALTDKSADWTWCGEGFMDASPRLLSYKNVGQTSADLNQGEPSNGGETAPQARKCIPVDITKAGLDQFPESSLRGWQFCFVQTKQGWRLSDQGLG